jgi:hypothetical protein
VTLQPPRWSVGDLREMLFRSSLRRGGCCGCCKGEQLTNSTGPYEPIPACSRLRRPKEPGFQGVFPGHPAPEFVVLFSRLRSPSTSTAVAVARRHSTLYLALFSVAASCQGHSAAASEGEGFFRGLVGLLSESCLSHLLVTQQWTSRVPHPVLALAFRAAFPSFAQAGA